eukprot:CAMPEP_0118867414 /NCGR_PEP_ID=MMETSP1163-20130328/10995_1 /TAXON_ID=124430 /ORGANISM="Phaeomonas parva, Strain CCMP2877" /LENGTH=312 /DNA_ID=CAMNT_0006801823 /DNA_START=346 /DNA_END=1281 /DNA_ORIENTATION=-
MAAADAWEFAPLHVFPYVADVREAARLRRVCRRFRDLAASAAWELRWHKVQAADEQWQAQLDYVARHLPRVRALSFYGCNLPRGWEERLALGAGAAQRLRKVIVSFCLRAAGDAAGSLAPPAATLEEWHAGDLVLGPSAAPLAAPALLRVRVFGLTNLRLPRAVLEDLCLGAAELPELRVLLLGGLVLAPDDLDPNPNADPNPNPNPNPNPSPSPNPNPNPSPNPRRRTLGDAAVSGAKLEHLPPLLVECTLVESEALALLALGMNTLRRRHQFLDVATCDADDLDGVLLRALRRHGAGGTRLSLTAMLRLR